MGKVGYVCRDGVRLITRNLWASVLTVFTAVAVFFVIGVGLLFVLNMKNVVASMEDQLTIEAYLQPDANVSEIAKSAARIKNVRDVKIITKQMALDSLRARIGTRMEALNLLGDNPLPDSIEITMDDAYAVPATVHKLEAMPGVEDVIYAGKVAEYLTRISNFISEMSLVLLIIAVLASGIVLFNTVKLAVFAREEEIKVMLLVGASPTYIALPYVIQGLILGVAGSLFSFAFLTVAYVAALGKLREMMPFLPFVDVSVLVSKLGLLLLACGITVSLIASYLAVSKFLRKASKPL